MKRLIVSGVALSLVPFSAMAASIPQGAQRVPLLTFTAEASCAGNATLDTITLKHAGLGAVTDIQRVYLATDERRLSPTASFSQSDKTSTLRPRSITIPACTSQKLTILADFSPEAAAGGQHRLAVENITAKTGSVSIKQRPAPSFETVPSEAGSISVDYRDLHAPVRFGNNRTIARILFESDATFDQQITNIALTNKGSAHNEDLQDIRLYDGDKLLGEAVKQLDGKIVRFQLEPAFRLNRSQSILLTVKADVYGRAKRTIQLSVDEPSDIEVIRQQRSR